MNTLVFILGCALFVFSLNTYINDPFSLGGIIFSAIGMTAGVILFISAFKNKPKTDGKNYSPIPDGVEPPYKSRSLSAFLCLFFGMFGIHMFYIGRPGRGIIYAIINILLFRTISIPITMAIVCICDLVNILTGKELDCYGRPLI